MTVRARSERGVLAEGARPHSELGLFLKPLRGQIDPDVAALGPYPRLPSRLGKRVTQEELAEAIGVSREWYAMLESATETRTSPALLHRLANALMLAPEQRARLFQLAVPEVRRAQLRDDSMGVLEGFSRLRSLTKRLWAATSIEDVFTTASEDIASLFDGALLVHTSRRLELGLWKSQSVTDEAERNDASKVIKELEEHVLPDAEAIDAAHLFPRLANAGDTGTEELHPAMVRHEVRKVCARRRLPGFTFVKARVRSRSGLVGDFCVLHTLGHTYSDSDRAVLGAFAELVSLALS
jgi:transcriptional regulator with XRE-family HTH domain